MQNALQASCLLVFNPEKVFLRNTISTKIKPKTSIVTRMSGIYKGRDMKYGVYEYGYLQVHHLFWCWCRGRVAQEQHCFSHCCHYSDNFHQP